MKKFVVTVMTLLLSFGSQFSYAQLQTFTGSTGFLVTSNFLGLEYTISNINFTGFSDAIGSFIGDSCNVGLSKGIVMTTGSIYPDSGPQGPNDSPNEGIDNGAIGYPLLNAELGFDTYNASVLEFDFVSSYDSIKFKYVFGSDEYPEFLNPNVADQMRIYLSGPGILGVVNIARLPSGQPIGINTVNPSTNPLYYVDNGNGNSSPQDTLDYYIQYDGFTIPLLASAEVIPGEVYHLRFVVADLGDYTHDSGIFIEQCETCNFNAALTTLNPEEIICYPNPSSGNTTLKFPSLLKEMELEVLNMVGQLIRLETLQAGSTSVELSELERGTYILRIQDINMQWKEKLVVIND
ncbi:MAG: hypothetical protein ACI837_001801 [Crocinitomicaceae bacterium]|jgi:hypothetical protein